MDSLPTKTGIKWRNLVNFDKIVSVLKWYKVNNPLYKDVTIDATALDTDDGLIQVDVPLEKAGGELEYFLPAFV